MTIIKDSRYFNNLRQIIRFIALDSPNNARAFKKALEEKIKHIPQFPYANRKSIYFDDENIRDMIFKGYSVVYWVDKSNNQLVILGIVKYKEGL